MIPTLAILGSSGDLTGRLLMPAIARLIADGGWSDDARIVGVDRHAVTDDEFRALMRERLAEFAGDLPEAAREDVLARLHHEQADVTDADQLRAALDGEKEPLVVYLALPNTVFRRTIEALADVGLPDGSKLVVEKPFGADLADARALNALILERFDEQSVFRVDHFVAKQTVLDVLGLRFANRIFEPVWNALHVESVEIDFFEELGLEGRAGYYDHAGALRDMIQNHLLQMLAFVAMEPPTSLKERDLRDRKVDALRAVRPPAPDEMAARTRRARYTAGRIGEREFPSYVDEDGVDPARGTETYAEMTVALENWRWAGVPFTLRTGKALGERRREIIVHFRPTPHMPFAGDAPPNELHLRLDPDSIALDVNLNGEDDPWKLERASLDAHFPKPKLSPYSLLLAGVLDGDPTLSIRGDEAEESWRIVEPVLAAWAADEVPLEEYAAGTAPEPRR